MDICRIMSIVLALFFAVMVAGCSNALINTDVPRALNINILADGSKQFVYLLGHNDVDARMKPRVMRGSRKTQPAILKRVPSKHDYQKLQRHTAKIVLEVNYCRDGYLELDYRMTTTVIWLRGECRETATKVDLKHFGGMSNIPLHDLNG